MVDEKRGSGSGDEWKALAFWIKEAIKRHEGNIEELFQKINSIVVEVAVQENKVGILTEWKKSIEKYLSIEDFKKLKPQIDELNNFKERFSGKMAVIGLIALIVVQILISYLWEKVSKGQ